MGTGDWFKSCGINENVNELTWWQSKKFRDIEFVFTPAQHWCRRGANDKNKALWGSWTLIGPSKRLFLLEIQATVQHSKRLDKNMVLLITHLFL